MTLRAREVANAIVISAGAYVVLFALHHTIFNIFDITSRTAVFFIPAAARVFCTLIFGYWAGVGIAFGTLLNALVEDVNGDHGLYLALLAISVGMACSLSLLLWSLVSRRVNGVLNPEIDFLSITWRDILGFSIIQALMNSSITHVLFYAFPDYQLQTNAYLLAVMFIGDLSGAFLVFIASNLFYSLWLRVRLRLNRID
jgi:hypothetical protein